MNDNLNLFSGSVSSKNIIVEASSKKNTKFSS